MTLTSTDPTHRAINTGLHITSDGTPNGTFITLDDGTVVRDISRFQILADRDDNLIVTLEVRRVPIDLEAKIKDVTMICPCCGNGFQHKCGTSRHGAPDVPSFD